MLDTLHMALGMLSGGLVGFSLGLVGGGGSILAVPLMVYLVGVASPHVAIGTSALAVAANAASGLASHAREHTVAISKAFPARNAIGRMRPRFWATDLERARSAAFSALGAGF